MPPVLVPAESYYLALNKRVLGTPVTVTRPNNVNAYAQGKVWGTAADGRFALAVPALPADAQGDGFSSVVVLWVNSRGPADAAFPNTATYVCPGGFTTVLGDQAAFALNDADIGNLMTASNSPSAASFSINTGTGASMLNAGAAGAGRRGALMTFTPVVGNNIPPGSVLGLYAVLQAAYTPIGLETLTAVPYYVYPAKVTLR